MKVKLETKIQLTLRTCKKNNGHNDKRVTKGLTGGNKGIIKQERKK